MAFYKGNPDLIIRSGTIVDGTGKPRYYADIAVEGDKIAYIGNLKGVTAPKEIDATFQNPTQYCSGMEYVIVNGTPVIAEGKHTGARPGMVLRHK